MNTFPTFFNTNLSLYLYMVENWKDIKGYEGLYQISDNGVVKGLERMVLSRWGTPKPWKEKTIKTIVDGLGYCRVSLCKNGKTKAHKIHRLVAEAFLDGKGHVNHKDGNKLNNNVSNLEFCTSKENNDHAYATGLKPKKYLRTIICNETNELFTCQADVVRRVGLSPPMISSHLRGNIKQIKGLTYRYL